eukprot:gnl/MRDRNA2_/MRDRNA2_20345_c0_seq2.p1 gnl/MRDRNA2_/MRDRNA2_20345_c0~~gnl/MRDRNA2_/MRDRNA2_20345_c0_seq2.p1  ORF type:complete len:289 (+),score=56.31 gnl/MRDRNA2_/MRDRNA2_20345_c0_seq2:59-925(+)
MSGEAALKAQKGRTTFLLVPLIVFLTFIVVLWKLFSPRGVTPLCEFDLPLLAHDDHDVLLSDARMLLEDEELLPFEQHGSSRISQDEADLLNQIAPKEGKIQCNAATYGTYPLRLLAAAWRGLREGDVLVDLGAGVGYVLAAVVLLTNSSGRGIELSGTRAQRACEALTTLSSLLTKEGSSISKAVAPLSAGNRHFSIWQADLFQPPPSLWEAPSDPARQLAAFSYCNCFGDSFIQKIMKAVAALPHSNVRLMISKLPKHEELIPTFGLRRVDNPGIHTYEKARDIKD